MLRNLAIQEGVEIRENANVVQVNAEPASVRLETGEIISGDIIVLADGCSSKLRSSVIGYRPNPPLEAAPRVLFVAFAVDISLLKDDKSFKEVLGPTDVVFIHFHDISHPYSLLVGNLVSRGYLRKHLCCGKSWFQSNISSPCLNRFWFRTNSWLAHCRAIIMVCQRRTMKNGVMHGIWHRMALICPLWNQGEKKIKQLKKKEYF